MLTLTLKERLKALWTPLRRVVFLLSTIPSCSESLQKPKLGCPCRGCRVKRRHGAAHASKAACPAPITQLHAAWARPLPHTAPCGITRMAANVPVEKERNCPSESLNPLLFTEQREGAASISLQPLPLAASNTTADWHGLLIRHPTGVVYVGCAIWWRAGQAYQQIPLLFSGQSQDLAAERHLVANRRTMWPSSQWLASCFPAVGCAPQPRAEGSREGTLGRQTRSAGSFHTWSQSSWGLETPLLASRSCE